ncbi:MAG TPA: signal peptide peptidase SppA [Xanthobacteraceae bacterium]|nr:signal peptide peptidase SppA [Xanthobacteraceae bacterium]
MSLDADAIVDRRRLRRRVTLWRTLALIAVVVVIAAVYAASGGAGLIGESRAHVARVTVGGVIRTDRERIKMLERIGRSGAEAVIVAIDSPGGTVVGAEQLYDALRRLAEKKPVVAVVNGLAASGGYVAALGTDRIFAHRNAIVGSIGVIFQNPNVSELLKTLGVTVEDIKSSPLKAEPNPYSPTSPEERKAMEALVLDSYDWFRTLVRERRKIDGAELAQAADGRVFTANQAMPLKLVDELGGERAAREWLEKNKNVSSDLRVRDWRAGRFGSEFSWLETAGGVVRALGLPLAGALLSSEAMHNAAARAQLDGLLALWHPSLTD